MVLTDQWLCQCDTWNSFLRKKCRNCNHSQKEATKEEAALQVVDRIAKTSAEDLERSEFPDKGQVSLN